MIEKKKGEVKSTSQYQHEQDLLDGKRTEKEKNGKIKMGLIVWGNTSNQGSKRTISRMLCKRHRKSFYSWHRQQFWGKKKQASALTFWFWALRQAHTHQQDPGTTYCKHNVCYRPNCIHLLWQYYQKPHAWEKYSIGEFMWLCHAQNSCHEP